MDTLPLLAPSPSWRGSECRREEPLPDPIADREPSTVVLRQPKAATVQAVFHHLGEAVQPLRMAFEQWRVLLFADLEHQGGIHRSNGGGSALSRQKCHLTEHGPATHPIDRRIGAARSTQ